MTPINRVYWKQISLRGATMSSRAEFDRVVERALANRPEDRYPSAGHLCRALLAALR